MEIKKTNTPGLVILVLSALGIVLSVYLTYLYYSKAETAFCIAGSGCDFVRESPYSTILGIPVAIFGVIGYSQGRCRHLLPALRHLRRRSAFGGTLPEI